MNDDLGCGQDNNSGLIGRHPNIHYRYNPFEIAVTGNSASDLIPLANGLVREWSRTRKVGVAASDGIEKHLGIKGKCKFDPIVMGAVSTLIIEETHYTQSSSHAISNYDLPVALIDADIVLILGKTSKPDTAQILVVDKNQLKLDDVIENEGENLIAVCGNELSNSEIERWNIPYLPKGDVNGIRKVVDDYLQKKIRRNPIYGLVLTGGKSTRMNRDKALLEYHGRTQAEHCYELLSKYCAEVFISNRQDQKMARGQRHLPQIHDVFKDFGPLGGILTALQKKPATAWLVLACDLPFIDDETIENLIQGRNPYKMATAYKSSLHGFPEPLCAIYEPKSIHRLFQFLSLGYKCPRKVLINSDVHLLVSPNIRALKNVNTVSEYEQVRNQIKPFL